MGEGMEGTEGFGQTLQRSCQLPMASEGRSSALSRQSDEHNAFYVQT